MKTLFIMWVAILAAACTPHEVRCEGRLERINSAADAAAPEHP